MDTKAQVNNLDNAVAIVGKGVSRVLLNEYMDEGLSEVWTLNDDYLPDVTTRHFEIHTPLHCVDDVEKVDDMPVVVMDAEYAAGHKNAELYPLAQVRAFFGWKKGEEYLSTTPAYMLALAIMWGRWSTILLPGIDYDCRNRQESVWERPCVEWYLGYATAIGIEVVVPRESDLYTTGIRTRTPYGVGRLPRDVVNVKGICHA